MGKHIEWREPQDKLVETTSETIEIGKGPARCRCYVARSNRVGPGVIVLHEFFGLQDSFRRYADDLAAEGFTVLAPDLYDEKVAADADEALAIARALDGDVAMQKLEAARDHLIDNWHPRLGTVGFSLGASFACDLAQRHDIDATVLYYGLGDVDPLQWSGPLLGHFAAVDEWEALDDVKAFFSRLEVAGIETEMHVYEDVGHWFANAAVTEAFEPDNARLAKQRTIAFLIENLA